MSSGHMQVVKLCLTQQDLPEDSGEGLVCMPAPLQTVYCICDAVLPGAAMAIAVYPLCNVTTPCTQTCLLPTHTWY